MSEGGRDGKSAAFLRGSAAKAGRIQHRPTSLIAGAIVLALVAPAVAQEEWNEFASREDGFSVNFPGQPRVEETTWTT